MKLAVDIDALTGVTTLARSSGDGDKAWGELSRLARDLDFRAIATDTVISIDWASFLSLTPSLRHLQERLGVTTTYSAEARSRLESFVGQANSLAHTRGRSAPLDTSQSSVSARLRARGWDSRKRSLTRAQWRDLRELVGLAHGANFSVPGAGKTTVELAANLLTMPRDSNLLVVAPKNAFAAWDQVLAECLTGPYEPFVRLEGGSDAIERDLASRPTRSIISYGQLVRSADVLRGFMLSSRVHLVADESHRMKAGANTLTGNAMLALAPFADRRDILSGTPMPNGKADLGAQFDFLWPSQGLSSRIQLEPHGGHAVSGLYVRTIKRELRLPKVDVKYVRVDMSESQRLLYAVLRSQLLREIVSPRLRGVASPVTRSSVMRLLQAAIDPQAAVRAMLLSGEAPPAVLQLAKQLIEEDLSPRMHRTVKLARSAVAAKRKVVIWAPFSHSIERLVRALEDLGALAIHGGVPIGDEADDETREGVVRQFHDDPNRMVLVANPAAGGEGISLHRVCHDAIYLGRTYNAAHYLQSRDRIHRLGLKPSDITRIRVIECRAPAELGSIDLAVRHRLDAKVREMSAVLNDPDLRILALESGEADATLEDEITPEDLAELLRHLGGSHERSAS